MPPEANVPAPLAVSVTAPRGAGASPEGAVTVAVHGDPWSTAVAGQLTEADVPFWNS